MAWNCLTANTFTAKLTNQFSRTKLITFDWQTTLSLDTDDDFCSGCQNVSHCHRQQSFSGLPWPRWSHYSINFLLLCSILSWSTAECRIWIRIHIHLNWRDGSITALCWILGCFFFAQIDLIFGMWAASW